MSGEPYATVIVPTHDRYITLPYTIDSIRAQTVPDIEIIIAGDGATPAVRAVAQRLAAEDSRVVFQDRPKGPRAGVLNRDQAVRSARAPRIFYSDDDDLLLPSHIATLGRALDTNDVVDSATVSVSTSGRLQRSLVNYRRGPLREALLEGRAKLIFDTHIAHRKSAYEKVGNPWTSEGQLVWSFFGAFLANPSISWRSLPEITALSFHGAARRYWADEQRADELRRWQHLLSEDINKQPMFRDWYFFRMLTAALPPQDGVRSAYRAIAVDIYPSASNHDDEVKATLSLAEIEILDQVCSLAAGSAPADICGDLLVRLADPLLGNMPDPRVVGLALLKSLPADEAFARVSLASEAHPHDREMKLYLQAFLLRLARQPLKALACAVRVLEEAGPHYPAYAHTIAGMSALETGDLATAQAHAELAEGLDRESASVQHLLVTLEKRLEQ